MSGLSLAQRIASRGLTGTVQALAAAHAVTVEEILGATRMARVVRVRHMLMRDLRTRGMSYPEIGWLLGKDHSTVIAACRSPEARAARKLDDKVRAGVGPGVRSHRPADVRGQLKVI